MEDAYTTEDFGFFPDDIEIVLDNFDHPVLMVESLKMLFKDEWKAKVISWKPEFTDEEWAKVKAIIERN